MGSLVDGAKITNRKNLERVAKQTGRDLDTLLALPDVDEELLYLLNWFYELKQFSGECITYADIESWDRLNGYGVTPDEVKILLQLELQRITPDN